MIRQTLPEDYLSLNNLVHFESYVHRHLDWRSALDWLSHEPFLVAERDGRIVSALACPSDAPEVAWVRLFATISSAPPRMAWPALWEQTRIQLIRNNETRVGAVGLNDWFIRVIMDSGFQFSHNVVVLSWQALHLPPPPRHLNGTIRPIRPEDLPQVLAIDTAAFEPLWRMSATSLQNAYENAALATVYEDEHGPIAYQLSTPNPLGGHLARLAVLPQAQQGGIGYKLVHHLLESFLDQGALQVTVNTQSTNRASLALYQKAGFKRTGEAYPIYEYILPTPG